DLLARLAAQGLPQDEGGVYILRNPSGLIYKVGKVQGGSYGGFWKRMEDYARYWVSRGGQIRAEIYPLSATGQSLRCAEMVLRRRVRADGWPLASDGSGDELRPQGYGGWSAGVVS